MRVRRATALDLGACVRMGLRFVTDTAYRGKVTANVGQLQLLVEFLLDHGAVFVAQADGGDVVGMIGASVIVHPISGELTGSEVAWWVEPEYRGGLAGVRLVVAAEAWAREAGALRFQMIAPAGEVRVAELYRRRGYDEVETIFQRDLVSVPA
jgi:GNAT superfamily N-acetyltransferase